MAKFFLKPLMWLALFFIAFCGWLPPAIAKDFSGHYYLQDSTDVGSELILSSDGGFEWTLAYGVTNKYSAGKWVVRGKKLILNFDKIDGRQDKKDSGEAPDPISINSPFDKLELVIKGSDLVSEEMSGKYVRR
jgi:hypothetical protein